MASPSQCYPLMLDVNAKFMVMLESLKWTNFASSFHAIRHEESVLISSINSFSVYEFLRNALTPHFTSDSLAFLYL